VESHKPNTNYYMTIAVHSKRNDKELLRFQSQTMNYTAGVNHL